MRSISGMLSDELAGDAKRRVPLPIRRKANAKNNRGCVQINENYDISSRKSERTLLPGGS